MGCFKKFFLSSVLWLVLIGSLVQCLCGCSGQTDRGKHLRAWMEPSSEMRVLSTTAQIDALVSFVGGERVKTWVLIQGDLDPHSYELVKGDDEKFFLADTIFYNGLGLEHGASLSAILRKSPHALSIGESIAKRSPEKILKKGEIVDPHLWMDISVWQQAIEPIIEKLTEKDPEGAFYYRERGDLLAREMTQTHLEIKELLQKIPSEKRYLLTSHDAFRYFVKGYLSEEDETCFSSRFAAPEGLAPDGQLSPVDIQRMIAFVQETKITVLFPESNVSRDSIKKIASAGQEMGLVIRVCSETLYGDSMSGLSYFDMMRRNADVIARGMQ